MLLVWFGYEKLILSIITLLLIGEQEIDIYYYAKGIFEKETFTVPKVSLD